MPAPVPLWRKTCRRERVPIIAVPAEMDKVTRMSVRSVAIETGQLYLPTAAPWLADFETELLSFPNGRFDDQVDTVSQLLTWLYYRPVYTRLQGRCQLDLTSRGPCQSSKKCG